MPAGPWLPRRFWLLAAGLGLLAQGALAAEPPRVVASILPIQSLAAAVMQGVAEPHLLVANGASPHGYQLRPSESRALAAADLVFWVGPALETFLAKPHEAASDDARWLALMEAPGIELLPAREGGAWEPHDDADHAENGGEKDPHIWLDPANAAAIAAAMAEALATVDPERRAVYASNLAGLQSRLVALDQEIRQKLAPVRDRPFIVFHDAYHYLEDAFDLAGAGSITVSPERPPGARRLTELRARIRSQQAVCIFAEPQIRSDLVQALAEGTDADIGELDAEGSRTIAPGPDAYLTLMRNNAEALSSCLARPS